jgi:4-amino-4-deoxy-L-arabinose transferase-like glycosyltransferase
MPWVLCLAAVSVGLKNFEQGLSMDAPIYAAMARNIARSGELFDLHGNVDAYRPFIYHPPLGMWLNAIVFKIVGAADWSARIVSQLYYIGFLLMLFFYVRRENGEKIAVWTVLVLWTFSRFSNYFSNVYLDPGVLFWGSGAVFLWKIGLEEKNLRKVAGASACLAVTILYKGLAAAGFVAPMGIIWLYSILRMPRKDFLAKSALTCLCVCALILVPYVFIVLNSNRPDFFTLYWNYQMLNRIGRDWRLFNLFDPWFWGTLWRDTNYFLPLMLLSSQPAVRAKTWFPWMMFLTFWYLLSPSRLVGAQYWVYVMPWVAWLLAAGVFSNIKVAIPKLVRGSVIASIVIVFVVQYLPVTVHGGKPSEDELEIGRLSKSKVIDRCLLDSTPTRVDVVTTSRIAWYGDVEVEYPPSNEWTPPRRPNGVVLYHMDADRLRDEEYKRHGWCLHREYARTSLWLRCP